MKTPRLLDVDGFRLPPTFDPDIYRAARQYKPEKGRVMVATFPKCGTTWTLQIVHLILRKGVPPADAGEYFGLLPFMEMTPLSFLQNLPEDACIKTHLPFDQINFSSDVKYIYVARHPADCVVSFYHHMRYFPIYFFSDATFDDFFEMFIKGENDFGDYFDNLLSWYEHRDEPNVFLITFESLKADSRGMTLKIAKFMGDEYYDMLVADDDRVLKKVLEYSSVDFMKNTVDKFWGDSFANIPSEEEQALNPVIRNYARLSEEAAKEGHKSIGNFVRKGGVGEGKITLSDDQRERLQSRIQEKCADSDVMNLWKR